MDPCARSWEIDAYRTGKLGERGARSFASHLRVCADCRRQLRLDQQLRDRMRGWRDEEPDELTVRRLRARVCHDAATGPKRSSFRLRAAMGLAAAWLVAWGIGASVKRYEERPQARVAAVAASSPASGAGPLAPPQTLEAWAGVVLSSQAGRWSQSREAGVERVRLEDGSIRVHVRPQEPGERFLVTLPDGELEVRGTTFEVRVEQGSTRQVSVDEGVVALRLNGRGELRLGAREEWTAPPALARDAPPATSRPSRGAFPPASAHYTAAPVDPETAYAAAVRLLSEGSHDEAASAFRAFVRSDPSGEFAEDASFLEAVALARAGRTDAAAVVAEGHLAGYPRSFHRKEAAVLVARAAVLRGDCPAARAVLAPWGGDAGLRDVMSPCDAAEGARLTGSSAGRR
ncbi:MAG TPA: FecR domain-containing protein [Polyangiaceae bacterium]|nr:FecR domain-containing protein [Polyangiaceae bacterium]